MVLKTAEMEDGQMEAMVHQETLPVAEAVVLLVCSLETHSQEMDNHLSSLVLAVVLATEKVVLAVVNKVAEAKEVASVDLNLLEEPEVKVSMVHISLAEMATNEDSKHKEVGLMALEEELVIMEEKVVNLTLLLVAEDLVTVTHNVQASAL